MKYLAMALENVAILCFVMFLVYYFDSALPIFLIFLGYNIKTADKPKQ